MILYCLLVIAILPTTSNQTYTLENSQVSIKAGIAVVNFDSYDSGTITINYAKAMPDNTYNTLATMAYINNYLPSQGLNFSANCNSESNQAQMKCAIIAESNSSSNILYMTYVVSDQRDFIVGSFPMQFNLNGTALNAPVEYTLNQSSDTPFKVARNSIDFIPMISGVSSLDGDFGLVFSIDQSFQASTLTLQFSVTINEFHFRNLTITFGYILFLADRYPVTVFSSKQYEPNNPAINRNILYGINQINTITAIGQPAQMALVLPPQKNNTSLIYRINSTTLNNQSTNTSTANGSHIVRRLQIVQPAAAQKIAVKTDKFTIYLSEFQKLISDGSFDLRQVKVRSVTEQTVKNNTVRNNKTNIYRPVAPARPKITPTFTTRTDTTTNNVMQFNALQPAPAPAASITNQFQQIFATNGFSIIVNTTISDPVLYLELDPYVNVQSAKSAQAASAYNYIVTNQTNPSPIYISEPINLDLPAPIPCPVGFMVTILTRISILQKAYRNICIYCVWSQYFDWSRKKCMDFPVIKDYVNVVDLV